jgi:hypothetical protein
MQSTIKGIVWGAEGLAIIHEGNFIDLAKNVGYDMRSLLNISHSYHTLSLRSPRDNRFADNLLSHQEHKDNGVQIEYDNNTNTFREEGEDKWWVFALMDKNRVDLALLQRS